MRTTLAVLAVVLVAGATSPAAADPASDAPDSRVVVGGLLNEAPSYEDALKRWRSAEDVNAWIGARFEYDTARAMLLSETQRGHRGTLPIHPPEAFFVTPRGVCVDLSRFAVETLRTIDPEARPMYVMIEFDPVTIAGNTLRRHWVAAFKRDGRRYFFADSKRPGHIAGPYESTREFVEEYGRFRGRTVVAFREMESYERVARSLAVKRRPAEGRLTQ